MVSRCDESDAVCLHGVSEERWPAVVSGDRSADGLCGEWTNVDDRKCGRLAECAMTTRWPQKSVEVSRKFKVIKIHR